MIFEVSLFFQAHRLNAEHFLEHRQTCSPNRSSQSPGYLTLARKLISFLINTEATCSATPAYSRKTKISQISVMGVDGLVTTPQITEPLPCRLQNTPFSHSFLILPKCPTPILGRDLLFKFKAFLTIPNLFPYLAYYFLNLLLPHLPPHSFLYSSKRPNKVSQSISIPCFPNASTGIKPIISKLLCQSLLFPTHSPYNMAILLLKSQMAPTAWFKT